MSVKFFILLLAFLLTFRLFAASPVSASGASSGNDKPIDNTKWKLEWNVGKFSLGFLYHSSSLFQFGIKIDYRKGYTKENLAFIPGVQLSKHNGVSYLDPFGMLRFFKPFHDNDILGAVLSVSYSYSKVLGVTSNIITPEAGLNFLNFVTISYGYNVFLDHKYAWVSPNRISITLMMF